MMPKAIHIDQLLPFLLATYEGDHELVAYFDPGCSVTTWKECCYAIERKVRENYPEATIKCVLDGDYPIGYYIFDGDMLISFGMRPAYRKKEWLTALWEQITAEFSGPFSCVLYSINSRAITWLQKCGMKLLFDHVSILTLCPQEV